MRVRALKQLRGSERTADPGDEFEAEGAELLALLQAHAVEAVPRKVERAVEAPKVERAVEAPEVKAEQPERVKAPEPVSEPPKPKPKKRAKRAKKK